MLDIALSIIDRLISLLREGDARRETIFAKHIEPLFLDLAAIHADYSESFAEIALAIADNSVSEAALRQQVATRKRELEHVRVKFLSLIDAYRARMSVHSKRDPKLLEFVTASIAYFDAGVGTTAGGLFHGDEHRMLRGTWYTTMLDILENMGRRPEFTRTSCAIFASDLNGQLGRRWEAVTRAYAQARVAYAGAV